MELGRFAVMCVDNNDFMYTVVYTYIQLMPVCLTIYRDSVFHNSQSKAVQESTTIWTTIVFDRYTKTPTNPQI